MRREGFEDYDAFDWVMHYLARAGIVGFGGFSLAMLALVLVDAFG